jgi:4-amino-4-deoxy-L-arabinose transferase-like glycosyltransferase
LGAERVMFPGSLRRAVVLSFVLQVAAIGILHAYRMRTADNHFGFGWEMGCIGKALASGRGFSDPYCVPSGPSAWEPPVYPFLIGGVFRIFGIYSYVSAWILLTINSLFSALTCIPIYRIAEKTMGSRVAHWSVWTWALLPTVWYWSIHWVWDTTISPFILCLIFLTALSLEDWDGLKGWSLFGILWGVEALMYPGMLLFLPCCGLWVWHRRHRRGMKSLAGVVLSAVLFLLCLTPWLVRNSITFGKLVFIRDDFAQQLRLGNGPDADGLQMSYLQPNLSSEARRRFSEMGELAYVEVQKREAYKFIRENPGRFALISAKRFVYYWAGIPHPGDGILVDLPRRSIFLGSSLLAIWGLICAVRRKRPGACLFALLLMSYPSVYYFVYANARYRHPIEPELLILAVYAICSAETGRSAGSEISERRPA